MRRWSGIGALVQAVGALMLPAWSAECLAQVNVEPVRAQLEETGRTFQIRGALSAYHGNSNGIALAVGGLVGWSTARDIAYLTASGDYSQLNNTTSVAKAFAHLRYNRLLWVRVYAEAFAQWEIDRFRRITSRELLGLGPRFHLADGAQLVCYYGSSYMLELTQRRNDTGRDVIAHRWNNYATLTYRPHQNIVLSETLYFQPRFDDFGDYFLLSIFSAHFRVTETFSSGIDLRVRRESRAPSGVRPTDTELVNSLAFTF